MRPRTLRLLSRLSATYDRLLSRECERYESAAYIEDLLAQADAIDERQRREQEERNNQ